MDDILEINESTNVRNNRLVILPGEVISSGGGFLRGHGTMTDFIESSGIMDDSDSEEDSANRRLVATLGGTVVRVNKLISVKPTSSRYSGEIGDVVIGRITEVGVKQWKLDLRARYMGVLQLGALNLPGGALRRRTIEDQLQMRQLLKENDLISAEVSSFYRHGGVAVHTRSMRYGKLSNGLLVSVPCHLIRRSKQHFVDLPCGVFAIFGMNGNIWLTSRLKTGDDMGEDAVERSRMTDEMEAENQEHSERIIDSESRRAIARVRNCIVLLAEKSRMIFPQSVMEVYEKSKSVSASSILTPDFMKQFE